MKLLIVTVFLTALLAAQAIESIQKQYAQTKIIDGNPAKRGEFPHQARLFIHQVSPEEDDIICGGALISTRYVLTAAHCIKGCVSWIVELGGVDANKPEPGEIRIKSRKAFYHPMYDVNQDDVGLIELPQPVKYNDFIKPIRLPRRSEINDLNEYITMYVSGYGRIADNTDPSPTMNWVKVLTISNSECAPSYLPGRVTASNICTVGDPLQSPCQGDSGGALIRKDSDGGFTHIGIVSFVRAESCSRGYPAAYMRTAYYLDWIYAVTGISVRP